MALTKKARPKANTRYGPASSPMASKSEVARQQLIKALGPRTAPKAKTTPKPPAIRATPVPKANPKPSLKLQKPGGGEPSFRALPTVDPSRSNVATDRADMNARIKAAGLWITPKPKKR